MASAHESAEAPAVVDAVAPSTSAPVPDTPEDISPPHKRDIDLEAGMNEPAPPLQRGMELGQSSKSYDDDDDDEDGHDKCRVCHLAFDSKPGSSETMQLGCHCKEDLANAHRDCAEAWFKFKGNRIGKDAWMWEDDRKIPQHRASLEYLIGQVAPHVPAYQKQHM